MLGLGDYQQAVEDYDTALELDPELADTYVNRGEAWLHMVEWDKAREDLLEAEKMGLDIVASFHNDYTSVSDFEEKNGLQMPGDIAEMLGG